MTYRLADVDAAEREIRVAVPDALIARCDFGFSLSVARADKTMGYVVFCAPQDDQPEIIGNIPSIIAALKA